MSTSARLGGLRADVVIHPYIRINNWLAKNIAPGKVPLNTVPLNAKPIGMDN